AEIALTLATDLLDSHVVDEPTMRTKINEMYSIIYDQTGQEARAKVYRDELLKFSTEVQSGSIDTLRLPGNHFGRNTGTKVRTQVLKSAREWQSELDQLRLEQLETQQQLDRAQLRLLRLFIGVVVLGLIGLVAYVQRISRKNKIITAQKKQLADHLEQKDFLLKEIHHRVKNNLQVVSSLLNLQSKSTDDMATQQALDDGRSRVQSMALIHKNLYLQDHIAGMDVGEYFRLLVDELRQTYQDQGKEVETEVDSISLSLDVETLIPLGLIATELITNSFKYAFTDQGKGTLRISLDRLDGRLKFVVQDDGCGFNQDAVPSSSFGLRLISAFAERLNATYTIDATNGTCAEFWIPYTNEI
ncbi:MAG: sensor histidine kinase, partial [Bacteroidota bacterium]